MNFLAHFHLAQADDELLAGALLGDFIRGPLDGRFSAGIETGIALHRRIDAVTDHYIAEQSLHQHFPAAWRRYLGIMLDLYFDRILSSQWPHWNDTPLDAFESDVLGRLQGFQGQFPPKCQLLFQRLQDHSLLRRYGDDDILQGILSRISQRLPEGNPLGECFEELQSQHELIEQHFQQLYPTLLRQSDLSSNQL